MIFTNVTPKSATRELPEVRSFECCGTCFELRIRGWKNERTLNRAEETFRTLERQVNAFEEGSAVAELNRNGTVTNHHVARLVHRGLEYCERTDGAFDVVQGRPECDREASLREDREALPDTFRGGEVRVSGSRVTSDIPLDLSGLVRGYIADRVYDRLSEFGRKGFVDGSGDTAHPAGAVEIESPDGDSKPLRALDTEWNIATSAGDTQCGNGIDHSDDPETNRFGSRHDLVTVVAERDCTEADALATTLAAEPMDDALELITEWDDAEARIVHDGVFHRTEGFTDHVAEH